MGWIFVTVSVNPAISHFRMSFYWVPPVLWECLQNPVVFHSAHLYNGAITYWPQFTHIRIYWHWMMNSLPFTGKAKIIYYTGIRELLDSYVYFLCLLPPLAYLLNLTTSLSFWRLTSISLISSHDALFWMSSKRHWIKLVCVQPSYQADVFSITG